MNDNYFSNLNLTFNHPINELIWATQINIPYKINLDNIIKNNKKSILTLYHCNIITDVKEVILKYHLIALCKKDFNKHKKIYQTKYEITNNKTITFDYCFDIFNSEN